MEQEASDWDWDRLNGFLHPTYDEIRANLPYKGIRVDFAEADDVIGVVTRKAVSEGKRVLIVSADGDFAALQNIRVCVSGRQPKRNGLHRNMVHLVTICA